MSQRRPDQDSLQIFPAVEDEPVLESAHDAWARRLDAKRPLCTDHSQLAHHATAIVAQDLDLAQVAFWQRVYGNYVVLGAHGLNPAARRRPVPETDPALEELDLIDGIVRWDARRFHPPRSTWLPGNTTPDLVVVAIAGDAPVHAVSLAGDRVPEGAPEAVRAFVTGIDWDI